MSLFWGVGLAIKEKECLDPAKWKGRNKLGEILTKVRAELMKDPAMQLTESAPGFAKASELLNKGTKREREEEKEEEQEGEDNERGFDPNWSPDWKRATEEEIARQDAFVHQKPDDLP